MTNYDFYDMYAVIVCVRRFPENKRLVGLLNEIANLLDTMPDENGAEFNIIRKAIQNCGCTDVGLQWAETENTYTANMIIMKNKVHYHILSHIFRELALAVASNGEKAYLAADCFHNIPTLLVDVKNPKKVIEKLIAEYQKKYNIKFLKNELKLLQKRNCKEW